MTDFYEQGRLLERQEDWAGAWNCFQALIAQEPEHAPAYGRLARLAKKQGDVTLAEQYYRQALVLAPEVAETYSNLGNILMQQERPQEAIILYQNAVALEPNFAIAWSNLGAAYQELHQHQQAIEAYQTALRLNPSLSCATYQNLGQLLTQAGHWEEAWQCYTEGLKYTPTDPGLNLGLGQILISQGHSRRALRHYSILSEQFPNWAEVQVALGVCYQDQGDAALALNCYGKALQLNAQLDAARWRYHLLLPVLYNTLDEIEQWRTRFTEHLTTLIQTTPLESPTQKRVALHELGRQTNFYLTYQGQNDTALQVQYGAFAQRIMAANYPHWSQTIRSPRHSRIRVGYLSDYFYRHGVTKWCLGWLQHHNHQEFEIFCYHTGSKTDEVTEQFRTHSHHFYQSSNLEAIADQIRFDDLDILVYTDIGLEARTTQLAALRLTPVQCTAWGHPITSGLPTIDYYLSGTLLEPPNAQDYYTEKLVLLPNLGYCYPTLELPPSLMNRADFGITQQQIVYISCQSLFKYLPQHDDLYPMIAQEVPNALFLFMEHWNQSITERFRQRLVRAFEKLNLSMDMYVRILSRQGYGPYLHLLRCSDVYLDTLEFSSGNTALEAVACGLPIVTLCGEFMRGRLCAGILWRMDLGAWVASTKQQYICKAIALGQNPKLRHMVQTQIKTHRNFVFNDTECVRGLESFYRQVAQGDTLKETKEEFQ